MGRRPKNTGAVPRLRARKQKSGTVHYYYDHGGRPRHEQPLGSDYGLAIQAWAVLERGREAEARAADTITFAYVADRYFAEEVPKKAPRTQRDNKSELAKLKEFFNDPPGPLDAIDPQHVRQYMRWRSKTAKVRANREKALLSAIWNYARDVGYTAKPNPCTGIKGNTETGRTVYVEDDAVEAVLAVADEPLRDAIELAYLIGQRPSDTLKMDERDVRGGILHVRQGKTDTPLRMVVEGRLASVLDRIKARKAGYKIHATALIVKEDGQPLGKDALRYRFDAARVAAGVVFNGFQFRDLRAKAGTDKADSGSLKDAQQQLGHASVTMTEHYIRRRRGDVVKPTK